MDALTRRRVNASRCGTFRIAVILQQLGFLANVISGMGQAAKVDIEEFVGIYHRSPRLRQCLGRALAAKRLGRKVKPWDQGRWDDNCDQIMEDILVAKFTSTPFMREYILGIEGHFYEASPKDKIWGIGIGVQQAMAGVPHNGQNKLGLALDRARARNAATSREQTASVHN